MIRSAKFWEEEANAPLLNLEEGYFKENREKVLEKAKEWKSSIFPEKVVLDPSHKIIEGNIDENYVRIFVKDAERTFAKEENREKLIHLLSSLFRKFGDYSQSLGYVASFLLLLLEEEDAVVILEHLNFDPKYIPQYWRAQAVAFATDAFVFQSLMEKFHPEVAQHLLKNGLFPNTYSQKWFSGLNIHVLSFEPLMDFLDQFFQKGHIFSFQFGLALVDKLAPVILKSDTTAIFELLRLDPKNKQVKKELAGEILEIAKSGKYEDLGDLEALRKVAHEKVKAQLEAAQRRHAEVDSDDEIVFSDEEEEEGGEEKEEEGSEEEELEEGVKKLSLKGK